jgi:hypothetical protein
MFIPLANLSFNETAFTAGISFMLSAAIQQQLLLFKGALLLEYFSTCFFIYKSMVSPPNT